MGALLESGIGTISHFTVTIMYLHIVDTLHKVFLCSELPKPGLHQSSNPGSTHFRSRTEFQSTNGCGLSQPGLQSGLGAFTLEVNLG